METHLHAMPDLFAQLGLPSSPEAIEAFLAGHGPLAPSLTLPEAPFWTPAQAAFLRDQVAEDADWAGVIDELDTGLRRRET
jgi:hypothetical protein